MKQPLNCAAGLLLAGLLVTGCASSKGTVTPSSKTTAWEYWSAHGQAGSLMPGTETRIEDGWEIVTLSISGPASDPYAVVVLRRPKK